MAKGDHDAAMNAVNTNRNQFNTGYSNLSTMFGNQYKNAYSSDQGLKQQITDQYTRYMNPENINSMFSNMSSFMDGIGGVSGGIDPSHISNMGAIPYAEYSKMSQQGNDYINPQFKVDFAKSMAGVDTANKSYQDFIDTGGFSQADIDAMRAQGVAPTRQIYQNAQDDLARSNAISGGNLGNASVASAKMASDAADKIGIANTNTEANLAQMKQQGKEFGTTGLGQTSLAQAQARTAVQQLDAQLKEAGLAGMTDIEKTRLMGELQNAQINSSASAANANIGLAKAGLNFNIDKAKADYGMNAADGLNKLYGTTPGDTALSNQSLLQLQQLFQSGQLGLNANQISAGNIPSNFAQGMGNFGSILGAIGQVAGAFGGGGFGGGNSGNSGNSGGNSSWDSNGNFTGPTTIDDGSGSWDGNGNFTGPTTINGEPTENGVNTGQSINSVRNIYNKGQSNPYASNLYR